MSPIKVFMNLELAILVKRDPNTRELKNVMYVIQNMAKIRDIMKTAKFAEGCPSPSSSPPQPGMSGRSTSGINGCKMSMVLPVKFFHFLSTRSLSSASERDDGILNWVELAIVRFSEIWNSHFVVLSFTPFI